MPELFSQSERAIDENDERAQLITIVETLATHMAALIAFVPKEQESLIKTTLALSRAALDYIRLLPEER